MSSERTEIVITVERRQEAGSSVSAKLRREKKVPAVVYGGGKPTFPVTVSEESVLELLKQKGGENTIFLLKLAGTKDERRAMIKELQLDPITGEYIHIDFIRVTRGHALTVTIPVRLDGDSVGVREGGRLDFITRDLQVEVMPRDMFNVIEVDISDLAIDDSVTVADLEEKLPKTGKFLEDPYRVVVQVSVPRVVEEEEEEEEDADLVISEQAEPELIRKTKEEGEED